MIIGKYQYSNIIDEKLKNYLKRINDKFLENYQPDKLKMNKYNNLIKAELNNEKNNSTFLLSKKNYYSSLLVFLMGISFFSGYQFRGFLKK